MRRLITGVAAYQFTAPLVLADSVSKIPHPSWAHAPQATCAQLYAILIIVYAIGFCCCGNCIYGKEDRIVKHGLTRMQCESHKPPKDYTPNHHASCCGFASASFTQAGIRPSRVHVFSKLVHKHSVAIAGVLVEPIILVT
eukprot:3443180-Amphidinium_carterae.1